MSDYDAPLEVPWRGRFVEIRKRGRWEFAGRTRSIQAAVILALDAGDVILIDQYRVPLGRRCLELPAGLVGDEHDGDTVEDAARRELEEEAGYRAARVESLGEFHSSPGMVSEGFTLVRATGSRVRTLSFTGCRLPTFRPSSRRSGPRGSRSM